MPGSYPNLICILYLCVFDYNSITHKFIHFYTQNLNTKFKREIEVYFSLKWPGPYYLRIEKAKAKPI